MANPHEVDRAFWHPLHDLTQPGTFREECWRRDAREFVVAFFELDDETVWGATARVLHQLLRIAHGIDEHVLVDEIPTSARALALAALDWCGYEA